MSGGLLRYSPSGHAVILPGDDTDAVADALIRAEYAEEFCLSPSFDPPFVKSLMEAGFLVMSLRLGDARTLSPAILLPKLHQERAVLDLASLHESRSVRRLLHSYELRVDEAFPEVLLQCTETHGDDWLTGELRSAFLGIRKLPSPRESEGESQREGSAQPSARMVSFELFRGEQLVAGEFGVIVGGVYTSYSGYREEPSAGTVQMILTGRRLRDCGFGFWDLGMPMKYKEALGARSVGRKEFVKLFREERTRSVQPIPSATIRA